MKKKKSIKFAPVFRPIDISVVGVDGYGLHHRMMIINPGVQYGGSGQCVVYIHLPTKSDKGH